MLQVLSKANLNIVSLLSQFRYNKVTYSVFISHMRLHAVNQPGVCEAHAWLQLAGPKNASSLSVHLHLYNYLSCYIPSSDLFINK